MFPDDVVFRILREEIEYFSTCLPSFCLKEIRIIIFAKQPITKRTPGPRRPPPFSIRPPPSYSAIPSSRTMSFWPVCVSLLEGDITQHPVDAIINVLPNDLQLSKGGSVCKRILETGGQTVQDQLNTIGKRSRGFIVRTTAGSMRNAQTLLHFVPSATDAPSLQCSIAACLNEVKALSLASVSISAIGTGPFRITARNSAEIILKAVKNFSTLYYPLDVNVIVFQRNMIQDFETVMQAMAPQSGINRENARHSSNEAQSCGTSPSQSPTVSYFKPLSTGEPKQVLKLDFIGCSNQDIDASIDEVNKFVKGHTKTKEIEHENVFDVLVDQWSNVEKLAHDQDVKITCRAPAAVCIEGLVTNVSESKEELSRLINAFVEKERKINQRKYISRNVQWYCFQGGQPVKYDEDQNELIETAFMENREIVHISKFGDQYEIDLTLMTEKSQKNGHVGRITRKRLGESDSGIVFDLFHLRSCRLSQFLLSVVHSYYACAILK